MGTAYREAQKKNTSNLFGEEGSRGEGVRDKSGVRGRGKGFPCHAFGLITVGKWKPMKVSR